ncbi:Alpha/Beta hydrolase protein [Aspergillus granulosus]|uniref:Carboxylic ester hydrolase n=1 Tax=Aspergillus granulosus TaxID=176169 RepID=A0ABR4HAS9_9EURO
MRLMSGLIQLWLSATGFIQSVIAANSNGPIVNLGYATYQGYHDSTSGLNVWKGIRYAAAPVGKLRWQSPQEIRPQGRSQRVIPAVDQPPICPQSGATGTPPSYGFNSGLGDEDCLFLNVYSAPGASGLPVLVWIHGGGYALFGATYDPSAMINTNDNQFITVEIQYRLGAFGFLSSEELKEHGQPNVGLLDQRFALEWVQKHISKFGGDPSRVTIGGESAGGGAVMLHTLAYGGRDSHLFQNIIAASPYSVSMHKYNDPEPTRNYNRFIELAGCGSGSAQRGHYDTTFDCLIAAPTEVLQNASAEVSASGKIFGGFAFLPVIDGELLTALPSQQLLHGHVSGQRILVGNNANDGVPLSNPTIVDRATFNTHIDITFPNLTTHDKASINDIYRTQFTDPENTGIRFDTLGDVGSTALNQSQMATGLQQTAFNIYAETTFDCPAQWLASAFSVGDRKAWKYQYSATPAYHGVDLSAYFSSDLPSPGFNHAFQKIWGNFIVNNTPVIPISDAKGNMRNATVPSDCHGMLAWPEFSVEEPWQMDMNTTGGTLRLHVETEHLQYYFREGPGIVNVFRLVDSYNWEGGRGERCDWWRGVAGKLLL